MNREQLMSVLIAPHVTEKTSLAMQNHNQYTFRVRRDATKVDVKKAVQLMFDVEVRAVQIVNEPGKTRRFGARRYILAPKGVVPGDEIRSGADAPIKPGNAMALRHIPVGSLVHNVELKPGKGGQLGRAPGGAWRPPRRG